MAEQKLNESAIRRFPIFLYFRALNIFQAKNVGEGRHKLSQRRQLSSSAINFYKNTSSFLEEKSFIAHKGYNITSFAVISLINLNF
jgi:hypothetical protein